MLVNNRVVGPLHLMIMVLKRMVKMYQKIEMRFGVYGTKSINKVNG
ncbi:hypothetical protein PPBDW_I21175 [Photobacterium kishitanii]|nr:hypothetical protein PPBDW_I21175 [Photobacterium kishitanii]